MKPQEIRIVIREEICSANYGIHLIGQTGNGINATFFTAKPADLIFEKRESDAFVLPEPWLQLSALHMRQFFQSLANELARIGFIAEGSYGDIAKAQLHTQTEHLKREQQILDQLLKIVERF